jgi:rsbT co-antagonist protein RsbR
LSNNGKRFNVEESLAQRCAELEQENVRLRERIFMLDEAQRIAHVGHWVFTVGTDSTEGGLFWSDEIYRIFDLPADTVAEVGQFWAQVHPDDQAWVQQRADAAIFGTAPFYEAEHRIMQPSGTVRWVYQRAEVFRDAQGAPLRMVGVVHDITDRRLAAELISQQEQVLQDLGAPVIPLAEKIVLLPLVGTIDSTRARQITEKLTRGVAAMRSEVVIIDITAVSVVDSQVAQALIQGAQAVKLLGARVVLTGIRPEVAQTIVNLGVTLDEVVTLRSIQDGIQWAMANVRTNSKADTASSSSSEFVNKRQEARAVRS